MFTWDQILLSVFLPNEAIKVGDRVFLVGNSFNCGLADQINK